MSKGILEFNLPEEQEEFEYAQNGIAYSVVIEDTLNWIRGILKYGPSDGKDKQLDEKTLEEVRSFIINQLKERILLK